MGRRIWAMVMVGVGVVGGGCATPQTPPAKNAAVPAAVDLVGPQTRLVMDRHVLAGRINGGAYAVQIDSDRAVGRGPLGVIDVRLRRLPHGYAADGKWNGAPVSFVIAGGSLRGSADRPISDEERRLESCHYDVEKVRGRASWAGREDCLEASSPVRFDFQPQSPGLDDRRTAVMLMAYLLAPPVRDLPGGARP